MSVKDLMSTWEAVIDELSCNHLKESVYSVLFLLPVSPWLLKGFMVLSENYPINFSVTSATFFMPRTFLTANNCKANEDFLEISFGFDT